MAQLNLMLKGYRLTTAEILYHMPDHPKLLQSFIWQELDLTIRFSLFFHPDSGFDPMACDRWAAALPAAAA